MSFSRIDSIATPHFSAVASICTLAMVYVACVTHDLCHLVRETFAVGDDALQNSATNDLTKSRL